MKAPKPKASAQQLVDALANRFDAPTYAFLPQVRDSTGSGSAGTADALAMSLWPSRGLELYGFEVKVSRQDWLRELKNPAKAENIAQFCDRWWVVAAVDVVDVAEVPPLWGLLVQRGKGLIRSKDAPKLKCPQAIDRHFLAAILRRAAQDCPYARRKTHEYEDGVERGKRDNSRELEYVRGELGRLRAHLQEFEDASGLRISGWNHGDKLGKAVKLLTSFGAEHLVDRADLIAKHVETQARQVREVADHLKAAVEEAQE